MSLWMGCKATQPTLVIYFKRLKFMQWSKKKSFASTGIYSRKVSMLTWHVDKSFFLFFRAPDNICPSFLKLAFCPRKKNMKTFSFFRVTLVLLLFNFTRLLYSFQILISPEYKIKRGKQSKEEIFVHFHSTRLFFCLLFFCFIEIGHKNERE